MGLHTTHDCWTGAYGSFARFRDALAKAAGYETKTVADGYGGMREVLLIDWGHVSETQIMGEWDRIPTRIDGTPDPLLILLAHSDCDGIIQARYCAAIADRLTELLPQVPDLPDRHRSDARRFVTGLRLAAERGEDVEFA